MKANIKAGIRYTFSISPTYGNRGFYASVTKSLKHTYGKRTAFGERTRWKAFSHVQMLHSRGSKFPTYEEAKTAAQEWIANRMAE